MGQGTQAKMRLFDVSPHTLPCASNRGGDIMKFFSIYVFPFVNNAAGWNGWLFNIFYD